ncbi:GerAB/ArcD/ProY family transporter [Paenibacillus sp. S150]|uniref:GerAB/ArcD/ProY family transporter n=1 Tax=Paenibacillus sp. S150 TaxID=2749826 RepID=UPI001C5A3946|nr:GerAB/ArcD/ProY family transporter [Paenibacillus sp. S150]MBW4080796.1 GerAB/ArcD/ProY family transporter [Paenibacillus sp. S150]
MHTSKWQLFRFSLVYFSSQTTIFLIPVLVESSGYQGWIALIGGGILSLFILFFTMQVGRLKPEQGWIDFGKEIMGKWVHRLMVLLLLCWCIYYASYDIENFVLFFGSNYMRGTPPIFIQIVIGLVIMYTATLGVSTIIYMAEGIFLIFFAALLFSAYLFLPYAEFAMLPAFLHYHDPGTAFKDSISVASWFAEWVVFLFVAPELKIGTKMLKRLAASAVCLLFVVLLGWMLTMLNFGPHLGKELHYPFLEMIRSSSHHNILGNLDPILIGIWSASMFIHGAFLIYIACKCALHLTKQKGKKFMSPFLTACSMTIAYLYSRNITSYLHDFSSDLVIYLWLVVECIPVYYFIAATLRVKFRPDAK